MKKEELSQELQQEFQQGRPSGIAKTADPQYQNVWFVVPPSPPTEIPGGLPLKALARAHRTLDQLGSLDNISPLDFLVARLLLRHEALTSSRMEGTWSTIDHVLTPDIPIDGAQEEASSPSSVRGYANALEESFHRINKENIQAFDVDLVCTLHKKIMEKDPQFQGRPGRIRTPGTPGSVVLIGGLGRKEQSIFNPCPPEHTDRCLSEVMSWFRNDLVVEMGDAGMGMTLPIRIAVGHSHFEAVHPFPDGNGRVGRMLWPLQMMAAGKSPVYLSGYVERFKNEYGEALEEAQKKLNYGPIIEFICEAIVGAFEEEKKTKLALLTLPESWRNKGKFRKDSAGEKTLNLLLKFPVLTAKELSTQLEISFPAASEALKKLVALGILNERTGFGRNRVFAAEEVISLLAREFGQDPKVSLKYALEKTRKVN